MNKRQIKFSTILKTITTSLCLFLIFGCESAPNSITGFSPEDWEKNEIIDSIECVSYRETVYKNLIDQQDKLKGKSEIEIFQLFGKPDQDHISKRMRKSAYYCIQGCYDCSEDKSTGKFLVVDFETLRRAKTIRIAIEQKDNK